MAFWFGWSLIAVGNDGITGVSERKQGRYSVFFTTNCMKTAPTQHVVCSGYTLYLRGYQRSPLRNIRISHCALENVSHPDVIDNVEGLVIE
jgi:hypothetical protein